MIKLYCRIALGLLFFCGCGGGVLYAQTSPQLLIFAVYYDTQISGQLSEGIAIVNVSGSVVDLQGWHLGSDSNVLTFPQQHWLAPNALLWVARRAYPFQHEFGFAPAYEHPTTTSNNPAVPDMLGNGFELTNTGDEIYLSDPANRPIDALVYEAAGDPTDLPAGQVWLGTPLQPYSPSSLFPERGQVLYRRMDFAQSPVRPVPDTHQAADWAALSSPTLLDNPTNGRKVAYRGNMLFDPAHYPTWFSSLSFSEESTLNVLLVAPDNIYTGLLPYIQAAQHSIFVSGLEFTSAELALALAARSKAGVTVRVLVDGSPAGGIDPEQHWACRYLETGQFGFTPPADTDFYTGECWLFKAGSSFSGAKARYNTLHAKYMLIDAGTATAKVVISSENWKTYSLPADDKANGTLGNRGVALLTNAPTVIERVWQLWQTDFQPCSQWQLGYCVQGFDDVQRWQDPGDVSPWPYLTFDHTTYTVQFPTPFVLPAANYPTVLSHAPENALNPQQGLLALLDAAGAGDWLLVQQLYEHAYWGASDSNPSNDPNPRLLAYQAAAQRGARVRMLLNRILVGDPPAPLPPDPRDNDATCAMLNAWAAAGGFDLYCIVGRVTGDDLHNKMVLAQVAGQGYVHLGSLNGSENANKNNRELAIQLQSDIAFDDLSQVFWYDWLAVGGDAPFAVYLPTVVR